MNATGPKERATFSLSSALKARLEEAIPKNERSRFVEKALDTALREEAKKELAAFLDDLPKVAGTDDSTRYLRQKRLEWDGRPIDMLEGRSG